jgi:carbonic anhydrase/acetyltransferase-like protein (isoleucine patch superfamily)
MEQTIQTMSIARVMHGTRQWLKSGKHPLAKVLHAAVRNIRQAELPDYKLPFELLLRLHQVVSNTLAWLTRVFYWTPLFKSQVSNHPKNLFLYGGLPYVSGPLQMIVGDNTRISGHTTFSARTAASQQPVLDVGSNVDIGWQTTIAVGSRVVLGDNVRIAGRAFLAGYPGHPMDASERAAGLPEHDDQVGDIVLEDDVWLATNVSVMAGVTIGNGAVVAAGSVVTKSLPGGVVAAGVPARVIRTL